MAHKVSHEDFVVAWVTANTIEDVVKATNLGKSYINQRAKRLRQAGVKLPELKRADFGLDALRVSQLNSLVNKFKRKDA